MSEPNKPTAEVSLTNEAELLACPFCGGEVDGVDIPDCQDGPAFYIGCAICDVSPDGCYVKLTDEWKAKAITAWNTRNPASEAVPAGWRLVPVEPTGEMLEAVEDVIFETDDERAMGCNVWQAMLSASPTPDTGGTTLDAVQGEIERKDAVLREVYQWLNDYPPLGTHGVMAMMKKVREATSHAEEGGK